MRGDTKVRRGYYANLPVGIMVFPFTPRDMDIFEMLHLRSSTSTERGTVGPTPYEFGLIPYDPISSRRGERAVGEGLR